MMVGWRGGVHRNVRQTGAERATRAYPRTNDRGVVHHTGTPHSSFNKHPHRHHPRSSPTLAQLHNHTDSAYGRLPACAQFRIPDEFVQNAARDSIGASNVAGTGLS